MTDKPQTRRTKKGTPSQRKRGLASSSRAHGRRPPSGLVSGARRPAPRGNKPSSAKPTHGGRRTGAGARPGNLNAVKTGSRSKLLQAAVKKLMSEPVTAAIFGALCAFVTGDTAAGRRQAAHALRLSEPPPS